MHNKGSQAKRIDMMKELSPEECTVEVARTTWLWSTTADILIYMVTLKVIAWKGDQRKDGWTMWQAAEDWMLHLSLPDTNRLAYNRTQCISAIWNQEGTCVWISCPESLSDGGNISQNRIIPKTASDAVMTETRWWLFFGLPCILENNRLR